MQPPRTDAAARRGAAPELVQPWGWVTWLWGHGPGGQGHAPGVTHHPDSPTTPGRAQTSAARATAAGQKESAPVTAPPSNSYLLLGFHTNACASANLGSVRSWQGADISASERRRRNMGSDTCVRHPGGGNRWVPREGWGRPRARLAPHQHPRLPMARTKTSREPSP